MIFGIIGFLLWKMIQTVFLNVFRLLIAVFCVIATILIYRTSPQKVMMLVFCSKPKDFLSIHLSLQFSS